MILHHDFTDRHRLKLLAGTIDLMRRCRTVGRLAAGQPPLRANPTCDLCHGRPRSGRLLQGDHAIGFTVGADGEVTFKPFPCPGTAHAMFWVCSPCWWLLRRDPPALLRKLAKAHGVNVAAAATGRAGR
jgi:hypothetical protein